MRRFWQRLCPRCLSDDRPIEEHPALVIMRRTEGRLDRLLAMAGELLAAEGDSPLPLPPRSVRRGEGSGS